MDRNLKYNLALISCHAHYFNLLECIEEFKIAKSDTVLVFFYLKTDLSSQRFFHNDLAVSEWRQVFFEPIWNLRTLRISNAINFINYKRLMFKLKKDQYDTLIASHYNIRYFTNCINYLKYNNLIALDEGNAVFKIIEQRFSKLKSSFYSLIDKILGLNTAEPPNITFFSVYNITVPKCDVLVKNNFTYSSNIIQNKIIDTNKVFIVGGPLVEDKILDLDYYCHLLQYIQNSYSKFEIYYIPHRRESNKNLLKYSTEYNFRILETNLPIELFLLNGNDIPGHVVGFTSAGLSNLHKILNKTDSIVISIKYNTKMISNKEYEDIENVVYENFAKEGISILEVN